MRRLFLIAIVALSTGSCLAGLADLAYEATIAGPNRAAKHGSYELSPPATRFSRQPAK